MSSGGASAEMRKHGAFLFDADSVYSNSLTFEEFFGALPLHVRERCRLSDIRSVRSRPHSRARIHARRAILPVSRM